MQGLATVNEYPAAMAVQALADMIQIKAGRAVNVEFVQTGSGPG